MGVAEIRIKVVSLADECVRIRRDEQKWLRRARSFDEPCDAHSGAVATFWSLRNHRMGLRPLCRESQLVYAFLRGVAYARVEAPNTRISPDWEGVWKTAKRHGATDRALFDAWRDAGNAYLTAARMTESADDGRSNSEIEKVEESALTV